MGGVRRGQGRGGGAGLPRHGRCAGGRSWGLRRGGTLTECQASRSGCTSVMTWQGERSQVLLAYASRSVYIYYNPGAQPSTKHPLATPIMPVPAVAAADTQSAIRSYSQSVHEYTQEVSRGPAGVLRAWLTLRQSGGSRHAAKRSVRPRPTRAHTAGSAPWRRARRGSTPSTPRGPSSASFARASEQRASAGPCAICAHGIANGTASVSNTISHMYTNVTALNGEWDTGCAVFELRVHSDGPVACYKQLKCELRIRTAREC